MANEVKIVVTGQNKSKSSLAEPKKDLVELGKTAEKASVTAEKALKNLENSADEAFDKLSTKMNTSFDRMGLKSKQAFDTKEVDRFKSSMDKMSFDIDFGSKGIGEKLLTGLTKATMMAGDWAKTGGKFAESMWSGFSNVVNNGIPPEAKAGIVAAGLTAAAAVGPLVGGALGGAVVGGFGAAIGGLAIISAAQSNKVQTAFKGMSDHIVSDTQSWTGGVESMLVRFAGRAVTTFDNIGPKFRSAIAGITPGLELLGDGLLKSVERFAPSFEPLAKAATAVFEDVGKRLPGIVGELSDEFNELAESVNRNPQALGDMIAFAGELVEVGTDVLVILNEWWAANKKLVDIATTPLEWIGLKDGEDQADATGASLTRVANVSFDATSATAVLDDAFKNLAAAGADVEKAGQAIVDIMDILSGRAPSYEESQQSINDSIRDMIDLFSDAKNHADGYGSALLNADGTVNTMTANGSKLQDVMKDLQGDFANSAAAVTELERAGMSHGDAVNKVNGDLNTQRERLMEVGRMMGLSKDEMSKLLDVYGLAPDDITTAIQLRGVKEAEDALNYTSRPREAAMWIKYYNSPAVGSTGGVVLGGSNRLFAHGGVVAHAAAGGVRQGDIVMNDGPGYPGEAVHLPQGSTVIPANMTKAMESRWSAGGGAPVVLEVHPVGNFSGLEGLFVQWLKSAVRKRGGSSAVFG